MSIGPKGRLKARRPRSIRASSTKFLDSTVTENRAGKRAAKGVLLAQRSNQNKVDVPEPTSIEVPMRRTGSSWMRECEN